MELPAHLSNKIEERKQQNAYRQLRLPVGSCLDFSSNDYLGIVKNELLQLPKDVTYSSGSTGSRLLTGNSVLIEETEAQIARFHDAEAALLFNSGYDANVGILSSIPQKNDTIIYDSLCHASIRDGIRLSFAKAFSFLHNDVNDLKKKIAGASGAIFVVTESVFSMDGDICPLKEIIQICNEKNAFLILDEAHAIGVVGEKGEGAAQHLQLQEQVFCRVYTFGKACGCHGAAVVGSENLKNYLINFCRSFVYTTALSDYNAALIRKSYSVFPHLFKERQHLQSLISHFRNAYCASYKIDSATAIQAIIVEGNDAVKRCSNNLQELNIDARPILYPTVPKGKERLRIILHAFNSIHDIDCLLEALNTK